MSADDLTFPAQAEIDAAHAIDKAMRGKASNRATAILEVMRFSLASLDKLDPAEQDEIIAALLADLSARRPNR